MATVTDSLETIMTLSGTDTVISGLTNVASNLLNTAAATDVLKAAQAEFKVAQQALLLPITQMIAELNVLGADLIGSVLTFQALAAAEGVTAAATGVLDAALALLESPLVIIAGLLAALTAGAFVAAKSLSAFSDSEDTIARLAIRMRNLGNVFPIDQLTAFSSKLGEQLGIDDELIAKTAALGASFGLNRQQIEKAIPVVLDVATFNKVSPDDVLKTIIRAAGGRPQGLRALGIDPTKIKGDIHDINNLISQIGKGFEGTAAAFRNTLPQSIHALQVATGNLFEAVGRFFSPLVIGALNVLTSVIIKATHILTRMADFFHLPTAEQLGIGGKGADIALKGDPEQTDALNEIAANTKQTAETMLRSVLGGPGNIARQAFTWRDAGMALKI